MRIDSNGQIVRGRPKKREKTVHPIIKILHAERKRRKISLWKMSMIMGYAHDSIGNWERGDQVPFLTRVEDYCNALGYELTVRKKT